MPKKLHHKASKGDKVCAVFTHHLRTGDKGYLHWSKVLAVEGSECTIKWQTDKKASSHSIADVFLTEAAAWAAFHTPPPHAKKNSKKAKPIHVVIQVASVSCNAAWRKTIAKVTVHLAISIM